MKTRPFALPLALAALLALGALAPASPHLEFGESDAGALDLMALFRPSPAFGRIGGQPPPFTLPAATGGPTTGQFRMAEHLSAHHPVAILFWATWCVPCGQELPFYQTLYERHRARDFHVVAISMDAASTIARVGPAARRLGVTYDVVTRVTSQLNPRRSAPFSIWVSRDGRITWEREGFSPAETSTVEAGIADLVGH
jgi:thiol-disulfide isomerase/thioredoxin